MSSSVSLHSVNKTPTRTNVASGEALDDNEDAEKNFNLRSPKFWSIIVGVFFAFFLVALDRTIIAVAIPRITDEFNSIQDIGWYGSAYALTCACFNPICGRIYKLYSTKWMFLLSILVFESGSALCGAAPNSTVLIVGRAIAGVGSAGVFSGGVLITIPLVPPRNRPIFNSMFGIAFGLASVLGPLVGGTLTDNVSWRWCFYINLPVGGFTTLIVLLFLKLDGPKREKLTLMAQLKGLDPIGISFFLPSIVCLILALQWGGSTDPWSSPKIIGLLVAFAVLFLAFVIVEVVTPETAMAPTRVVLDRSIAGSMAFMFLLSGAMISVIYYLAIWFQAIKDDSAMKAGVSTIPLLLSMIVMGIIGAIITKRLGYYVPTMLLAPVISSVGAGMLSTLRPDSNHRTWIGYQILYGLGIGIGFQNSTLAVQFILPKADVPIGLALMFFMQQLGGSVFLAVSQNLFSTKLVESLSGIAGLDVQQIVNTGVTDLRTIVPVGDLDQVLQAYNKSLMQVFILAAALSACMIVGALAVRWKRIDDKTTSEQESSLSKENTAELEEQAAVCEGASK